jgi:hypothetical protein
MFQVKKVVGRRSKGKTEIRCSRLGNLFVCI